MEHVNVVVSSEALKLNVAVVEPLTATGTGRATLSGEPGPPVMIVLGACASSKSVALNGSGPVSATTSWLPTRGGRNESWVAQNVPLTPQLMSSGVPLVPSVKPIARPPA